MSALIPCRGQCPPLQSHIQIPYLQHKCSVPESSDKIGGIQDGSLATELEAGHSASNMRESEISLGACTHKSIHHGLPNKGQQHMQTIYQADLYGRHRSLEVYKLGSSR